MISVIIPALNAEAHLLPTLAALVPAAVNGTVRELVLADGGSTDGTTVMADDAGAVIITSASGRGAQLVAGAAVAKCPWLLFLHSDTVLETGWEADAIDFIKASERPSARQAAAAFRFALDDRGIAPRMLERLVALRCRLAALPFGDQGLLISRQLYDAIGGFKPLPIMEDVDIVRRLGRARIVMLRSAARTSASRYRHDGYLARTARNQMCLGMYAAGVAPERIAQRYNGREPAQ